MLWDEVKKFTYNDLNKITWDDLLKDKFQLLQELQEKNIDISPDITEKLISLCDETIKVYNERNLKDTIPLPKEVKNKTFNISDIIQIINFGFQIFKYADDKLAVTEKIVPLIKQLIESARK